MKYDDIIFCASFRDVLRLYGITPDAYIDSAEGIRVPYDRKKALERISRMREKKHITR